MSTLIKNIHIKNFKSVRDLSLDCERINIFIGKPNAGKSNILEAISLLGAGYSKDKFMSGFIRYKSIKQLFSNFRFQNPIQVKAGRMLDDSVTATLQLSVPTDDFDFTIVSSTLANEINDTHRQSVEAITKTLDTNFVPYVKMKIALDGGVSEKAVNSKRISPVKKYTFRSLEEEPQDNGLFLYPPFGDNFYSILRSNENIREEMQRFVEPNGLDILFDEESERIMVVQKGEKTLFSYPLHLVPDTFQRYIFHLAAILSNRDSVLLFEEPESHSYPPYINQLAQHIVDDEGGNQFFITTHNPYLLTPILQEAKDVALFVTWFENFQTYARRLSEAELSDILNYGMDVFFNLKHFTPHEPSPDFA